MKSNSKKRRIKCTCKNMVLLLKEYCLKTSMHGFKYITEPEIDLCQRITWFLICTAGVTMSAVLIYTQWLRFQSSPTVMGIETTNHPIYDVPFPGVSVCNINKVYKPAAMRLLEQLKRFGFEEDHIGKYIVMLSSLISYDSIQHDFNNITQALINMNYTVDKLMFDLAQPCENLLKSCKWLGAYKTCSEIIQMKKTASGYCCAFNYHGISKKFESFRTGKNKQLEEKEEENIELLHVTGAAQVVALKIIFDVEASQYMSPIYSEFGVQVIIHDTTDFPELNDGSLIVQPGQIAEAIIIPTITETTDDVQSIDIKKRKCIFPSETNLTSSPEYTYQTCLTECRIRQITDLCKCVPFFYPNIDSQPLCTLKDVKCLNDNRHIFYSIQPPAEYKQFEKQNNAEIRGLNCTCYPKCSNRRYTVTTKLGELNNFDELMRKQSLINYADNFKWVNMTSENYSTLYVYYKDLTCYKYKKSALITWDGLLASFGGIFGLCLGGSIISLVEIFLYCLKIFTIGRNKNNAIDSNQDTKQNKITRYNENVFHWSEIYPSSINKIHKPVFPVKVYQ